MPAKIFAVIMLALLAGCAGNSLNADVTRFHLSPQSARGSVYLDTLDKGAAQSLEFRNYAGVVASELREAGFTIATTRAGAELIGVMDYGQSTREEAARRSPFTIGIGGGTGGRNVGVGVGASFGVGKKRGGEIHVNMLSLKLQRSSDNTVFWEGRAIAEAADSSPYASLTAAMPKLADALLRDFPGTSGQTVTYKKL